MYMITTQAELKEILVQYIGENWITGKEAAVRFLEEMEAEAHEKSVKELMEYFNDRYPLDTPIVYATIWQGAFLMKAFREWDDPEKELRRYLDEFTSCREMPEGKAGNQAVHADELSFEEQAAVFAGIELDGQEITDDFYELVSRRYPDLEEVSVIYMAGCMDRGKYKKAYPVVKKFESKYPEDFDILKRRLAIYRHAGTKEEVHKAAADMLEYQKKYNTYTGWVTLNYAANVQVECEDMEGALETFRHLLNDWSRLSLKEEEGCMYVASAFVNILQLPSRLLEKDIALIAVQFCMFEQAMERAGVDLHTDPYNNIITTFVVELSRKLGNPAFRPAFTMLLETLEERPVLKSRWFTDSFESGHKALESYQLNEDTRIPRDIRFLCLSLYSDGQSGEVMPYSEKYDLYEYVTADSARKIFFRDNYPILYVRLLKMLKEVSRKGTPEDPAGLMKMKPVVKAEQKVGRNDPCPCGSGKKYKKCCGR